MKTFYSYLWVILSILLGLVGAPITNSIAHPLNQNFVPVDRTTPYPTYPPDIWEMTVPRVFHGAIIVDNFLIVLGGTNGEYHGSEIQYLTGEVLDKTTGENLGVFSIMEPAYAPYLFEMNNQIYIFLVTGDYVEVRRLHNDFFLGEDESFSPPDSFFYHSSSTIVSDTINKRVYFLSGGEGPVGHNHCEYFDCATDTWVEISSLPIPGDRQGRKMAAGYIDDSGFVHLAGGATSNDVGSDVEVHTDQFVYDPLQDTWAISTPMANTRMGHFGIAGYWTGGQDIIYITPTPQRPGDPHEIIYRDNSEIDGHLLSDPLIGRVNHISYLDGTNLVTGGGGRTGLDVLPIEVQDTTEIIRNRDVDVPPARGAVLTFDAEEHLFYWIGGLRIAIDRELEASRAVDTFCISTEDVPAIKPVGFIVILTIFSGIFMIFKQ